MASLSIEHQIQDFCRHAGMADDSWADLIAPYYERLVEHMRLLSMEEWEEKEEKFTDQIEELRSDIRNLEDDLVEARDEIDSLRDRLAEEVQND